MKKATKPQNPRLAVCAMLAACLMVLQQGGTVSAEDVQLSDNLFLDATAGAETSPNEDTIGIGTVGFNWGIPLTQPSGGAVLGLQAGADVKISEKNPEWNATAGLFGRNFPSLSDEQGAAAILVDYQHTFVGNDIWALRPILGTTLGEKTGIGATATISLKDDEEPYDRTRLNPPGLVEEEFIDRVEGFINHDFSEDLSGELLVGYMLSDVDEVIFGPQLVYGLNEHTDIGAGAQINAAGDYAWLISMSYHFGGTGRHPTLHNIRGAGATLYTPFPKRQYANFLSETERPVAPGVSRPPLVPGDSPGLSPGGGPGGTPPPPPGAPPPGFCEANPDAPQCQPDFCELNPDDPACNPDPCVSNPELPQCNPDPCIQNPQLPQCNPDPCIQNPQLPQCNPDPCIQNPQLPQCNPDPCVSNPNLPQCKQKCNQGRGNDGEDCSPGKSGDKGVGQNDECGNGAPCPKGAGAK